MKQVLVIDENSPFREYLKTKLSENGVRVEIAINARDGIAKIRANIPDLIILDYHLSRHGCLEVLQSKKANPDAVNTPVIVMAQQIDQKKIASLTPYNVKSVFTKPIKVDALLSALSEILRISFSIDESPGIVEVHVNEDILFIEIAQGLNVDKLDLLRFRIMELMELCAIRVPKIIIMFSDMVLNFADAPNLYKLLHVVMDGAGARRRNIRILTRDDFTKKFIEGQSEYGGIEVVSNLQYAIDGLLANVDASSSDADASIDQEDKKTGTIADTLAPGGTGTSGEAMPLRFDAGGRPKNPDSESIKEFLQDLNIAAVDDDFIILDIITSIFRHVGVTIKIFSSGADFLAAIEKEKFDLVFLDLIMPGVDGFAVLDTLSGNKIQIPVIVLSANTQRDTVIKVFKQGIKSYIAKPFTPNAIINKTIEILRPSL